MEIRYYSVIYQAIDEIEQALRGLLKPIYEENQLGRAGRCSVSEGHLASSPAAWSPQV